MRVASFMMSSRDMGPVSLFPRIAFRAFAPSRKLPWLISAEWEPRLKERRGRNSAFDRRAGRSHTARPGGRPAGFEAQATATERLVCEKNRRLISAAGFGGLNR